MGVSPGGWQEATASRRSLDTNSDPEEQPDTGPEIKLCEHSASSLRDGRTEHREAE